jgi:hypothetical protein
VGKHWQRLKRFGAEFIFQLCLASGKVLAGMRPGLKDFCRLALRDAVVDAQPEQCTSLFPKWPDPIAFSCRFQMLYNGGSKSALCRAMDL